MKTHRIAGGSGVQLHVTETGNLQGRPIVFPPMAPRSVGCNFGKCAEVERRSPKRGV
jgi:hypothetical protein